MLELNRIRTELSSALIKDLKHSKSKKRAEAAEKLGRLSIAEGVEALIAALSDLSFDVRSKAAHSLAQIDDSRVVPALIGCLQDISADVRRTAALALAQKDLGEAIEPLFAALDNTDYSVRHEIIEALGHLKNAHVIERLLVTLQHEKEAYVKGAIVDVLGRSGDKRAVEPIISILTGADGCMEIPTMWSVRSAASHALVRLDPDRAIEPLVNALKDPNEGVRWLIPDLLVDLGNRRAVQPLIEQLRVEDEQMQLRSIEALVVLGHRQAVEPLISLLSDPQYRWREQAAQALGQVGDERAVEALIDALNNFGSIAAATSLGQIGDDRAVMPLIGVLTTDESWDYGAALAAAEALALIGSQDSIRILITLLNKEGSNGRENVAAALGLVGSSLAVQPLVRALTDGNAGLRRAAAQALGQLAHPDALEPLIATLHDKDYYVRKSAVEALGWLGDERATEPLITTLADESNEEVDSISPWLVHVPWYTAMLAPGALSYAIAPSLRLIGDQRAFALLANVATDSNQPDTYRYRAITTLGRLGEEEVLATLTILLRDSDPMIRAHASTALGITRNINALEYLLDALQDEDQFVRACAASALGLIGDARAVDSLISVLVDKEGNPSVMAGLAIHAIAGWELLELLTSYFARYNDAPSRRASQALHNTRAILSQPGAAPTHLVNEQGTLFTAFYPTKVRAKERASLYVYAHVAAAMAEVIRDSEKFAAELIKPEMKTAKQAVHLRKGTNINIIPECQGISFNPGSMIKKWEDDWMRFDFDMRPNEGIADDVVIVRIGVWVEGIEIAHIKFALEVMERSLQRSKNPLAVAKFQSTTTRTYQRIFVSYSRKDTSIVEGYRLAQLAVGNDVFIDTYSIRTGEDWRAALAEAIDQSDIFQLFWSESSAKSRNVRTEWTYALEFKCSDATEEGFIRPVYWKKPLPKPPKELAKFNFKYIPLDFIRVRRD